MNRRASDGRPVIAPGNCMPIHDRPSPLPSRADLFIDGRRLSYLDHGGPGRPLLALHGLLSEGRTFAALAAALAPEWRVIAPDQRGHGDSDRAADYSRAGYVGDAVALLDHLGIDRAAVIGHSVGGLNAYQLAAWHPERVEALAVEDIGAVVGGPDRISPILAWPQTMPTKEGLIAALGAAAPLFADALRERPDGSWALPFHPEDMVASEQQNRGDHWSDWLAGACPVLLVRGTRSQILGSEHAREMVARRAAARLVELDADHFVHDAQPADFAAAVGSFLQDASRPNPGGGG